MDYNQDTIYSRSAYEYGFLLKWGDDRDYGRLDHQRDEARIEQEIRAAMKKKITLVGGLCRRCDRILEVALEECGSRESDRALPHGLRFHDSKGLEAAGRAGCRMCSYVMHALEVNGKLPALRSLEQSLRSKEQSLWAQGGLGQVGFSGANHMTVDIYMGLRTDIMLEFHFPGSEIDGSHPGPLLYLDFWDRSKKYRLVENDLDAPQAWLRQCSQDHVSCRVQTSTQATLPTRLVSLSKDQIRLVYASDLAISVPYATLSHCWGTVKFLCLNTANEDAFTASIPMEQLTKTFRDAIEIVRRAGLNFIWIDSLCILQDNQADWERESAKMESVYRGSTLNIAASSAEDGTKGCFPQRPATGGMIAFQSRDLNDTVLLKDSSVTCAELIHDAHLETRAWCFQELILAPRTLYCKDTGFFWECREKVATQILQNGVEEAPTVPNLETMNTVEDWMHRIVIPYTRCDLTFSGDKLPALDGIAKALQPQMGSEYHAGLWTRDMKAQLCWQPENHNTRPQYRGAPSWSWASVDGRMSFWPRSDRTEEISGDSNFRTEVYNVISERAHSSSFGELAMGHLYINCSRLAVGYYYVGEQQDAHEIWICHTGNGSMSHVDSFQFIPDCHSDDMIPDNGADSAVTQQTIAEDGPPLVMLPLQTVKSVRSFKNNKHDWIHSKSIFGLVLKPTGARQGEYRRVGSFESSSSHGIGHDLVQKQDDCVRFTRVIGTSGEAMARSACAEILTDVEHRNAPYQIIIV